MGRNKTLDSLKGLAILLVVMGHFFENFSDSQIPHNIIYSFHIPLFFAVSGILAKSSIEKYSVKKFISNKFFGLFIPFVSWSMVAVFANIILSNQPVLKTFTEIFFFSRSMWYLWALFFTMLIFRLDIFLKTKIGFFSHLLIWIFIILLPNKYLSFTELEHFYPFFIAGYYFKLSDKKEKTKSLFAVIWIIITVFACIFKLPAIHSDVNFYEPLALLFAYVWGFCGVFTAYCIFSLFTNKLFIFLGRYTLDVYGAHMFLVRNLVLIPTFVYNSDPILKVFYTFIYSSMVCFLIAIVVKFILSKIYLYRLFFAGSGQRTQGVFISRISSYLNSNLIF